MRPSSICGSSYPWIHLFLRACHGLLHLALKDGQLFGNASFNTGHVKRNSVVHAAQKRPGFLARDTLYVPRETSDGQLCQYWLRHRPPDPSRGGRPLCVLSRVPFHVPSGCFSRQDRRGRQFSRRPSPQYGGPRSLIVPHAPHLASAAPPSL